MLEALHLTKIYKTKGGTDVRALDDVSIRFPEKGMVFLLGRSGSGKSTLLNVCGGLDSPSGGEIIVKGRSSKEFNQSDFDSYRNTFVGFIFQEYNILNEFSVEDNIALALELQGKTKDKKVIAKLLEDVDLTGYAKRKPNTLSGGQKQRIAIARALVKSPEIIMADEPTGALDSSTGKQVFDTLKKLSKDKLVIVVSHDREFAEQYGDRIIELKDGKVISDVTKTQEEKQDLSENISVVGDTLCVKKGSELTNADFEEIKNFLKNTENDLIIAGGEKDVKTFKEVSHIRENGQKDVFRDSDESLLEKKNYTSEDSRFIRSKLPVRHAFKIGVSGLKTKPIRLVFTILLCTVAFIFFGLLSTMTFYDNEATFKQSLKDSNYDLVQMSKIYQIKENWYMDGEVGLEFPMTSATGFTKEEVEVYAKELDADAFGAVSADEVFSVISASTEYWRSRIDTLAYLPENNALREAITGRYPENENEICISSYTANVIYNCRMVDEDTKSEMVLSSPKDIIGKKLTLSGYTYTVVGIVDSGEISEKYDPIKDGESSNYQLVMGLTSELGDGLHLVAFVTPERLEAVAESKVTMSTLNEFGTRLVKVAYGNVKGGKYDFPEMANAGYASFSKYADASEVISLVSGKTEPAENEVLVPEKLFYELVMKEYEGEMGSSMEAGEIYELASQLLFNSVTEENKETHEFKTRELTAAEREEKLNALITAIQKENKPLTLAVELYDNWNEKAIGEVKLYTVCGIWKDAAGYDYQLLFADKTADALWENHRANMDNYYEYSTAYVESSDVIYDEIFVSFDRSEEQTNKLWEIYNEKFAEDDSKISLTNSLISNMELIDMSVETLSKVFLWVGVILAVFAALLLSNFISVSISHKKKEIGILRAVGARSIDVFKIFFSESFIITAICVVISVLGSMVGCTVVNGELASLVGASLFVFGMPSFLVLVSIALVTVVVATFLPVWNAAKKKPVESIRAL